jgi:hypothetical protein
VLPPTWNHAWLEMFVWMTIARDSNLDFSYSAWDITLLRHDDDNKLS